MGAKSGASLFYNGKQLYAASTRSPCCALNAADRLAARAASAARPAPGLARQLRESEFLVLSHIVAGTATGGLSAQLRLVLLQVQV